MRLLTGMRRLDRGMVIFCLVTIVFLVYRDLALPHVRNTEVWFGFEVRGTWAMATAPLHWGIFAAGAWLFGTGHPRAWFYSAVYAAYIAFSHLIWNLTSPNGGGLGEGVVQLALFLMPAAFFFWVHGKRRSLGSL